MRFSRTLIAAFSIATLAVAFTLTGTVGGGGPAAGPQSAGAQTGSCQMAPQQARRQLRVSYVLEYRVRNVRCRNANRLLRAWHQCRRQAPRGGARGRCTRTQVAGFRCRETNRIGQPFGFYARVNCRRGGRRVSHNYAVNL